MKIYRLSEGKKIAGICAGIADSYNLDVTLVRLAAIFLTVITGVWPGVITYLAGWYLIPELEKSPKKEKPSEDQ
ncbi:PspC domain-containing protein [Chitinispirillales bacterium ANBcel5]|uniref:PspC domain-containing protein n=1 Tax=Cellulosispirillum alkaliphilum TaxID=3039283 RepID=UPI002A51FC5B|nr:PspC domain-containing protein [Chitinispirillales bacterium ANBcel5]